MYIDVLFALNFMMDAIVLLTVRQTLLRGRFTSWKRLFGGALAGAFGGCVLTVLGMTEGFSFLSRGFGSLCAGILLCVLMGEVAFRPKSLRGRILQILAIYGMAFLLGGMLDWLQQQLRPGSYFAAVAACFLLLTAGRYLYERLKFRAKNLCTVHIPAETGTLHLKGLLDTGNLLQAPFTKTPVSVVWADRVLQNMSPQIREQYDQIRSSHQIPEDGAEVWKLIPYHSVGCPGGLMPVLTVPYFCIQGENREAVIRKGLLGLSPGPLSSTGAYEIILNPKLLEEAIIP